MNSIPLNELPTDNATANPDTENAAPTYNTAPPSIHGDTAPPVYQQSSATEPNATPYHNPHDRARVNHRAALRAANNGVAKAYRRITFFTGCRGFLSIFVIALSAIVIKRRAYELLLTAAIYSIAAAATTLQIPGLPGIGPRAPDDARPPRWFGLSVAWTTIIWIPAFVIFFKCQNDQYENEGNYSTYYLTTSGDCLDPYPQDDVSERSQNTAKLGVGVGVIAVVQFLMGLALWGYESTLKRSTWEVDDIATVFYYQNDTKRPSDRADA